MEIRVKGNQLEEIDGLSAEYPYVFHHVDLRDIKIPWHWHEEVEFDYVVNGSVKLFTANSCYVFRKNEAFFINSNVLCTMESAEDGGQTIMDSHLFHPIFLGGHFKSIFSTKYLEPVLQNRGLEILEFKGSSRRQREILTNLKQVSFLQKQENSEFQTRNLFSEIWLNVLGEIQEMDRMHQRVNRVNQDRTQTMMSFIQQNYQNKISLCEIASSAAVSERECLRCFQQCIHKTPYEYLMGYRIDMAAKLLKTTDRSIVEVAAATGFSNGAYFGKIFKKETGVTPGIYRKNNGRGKDAF